MAAPVRKVIVSPKRRGDALDQDACSILFWRRLQIADFAAAGTTNNVDLTGFPGGLLIEGAFVYLVTDFAGGSVATGTISVGTVAAPAAYVAATTVVSGAPKSLVGLTQVPGTFVGGATAATAAGTIRVQLITDVNSDLLTAGKFDLYVRLRAASIRNS